MFTDFEKLVFRKARLKFSTLSDKRATVVVAEKKEASLRGSLFWEFCSDWFEILTQHFWNVKLQKNVKKNRFSESAYPFPPPPPEVHKVTGGAVVSASDQNIDGLRFDPSWSPIFPSGSLGRHIVTPPIPTSVIRILRSFITTISPCPNFADLWKYLLMSIKKVLFNWNQFQINLSILLNLWVSIIYSPAFVQNL